MNTIQAQVNPRLLTKAARLFTGSLAGRIIEILQNARRAGARRVAIANRSGTVTVRDDGQGIESFADLLDLGGSGWEADLEASEDPAGVGLFCLAPRELTVRSKGQLVKLAAQSWTGQPVQMQRDPDPLGRIGTIAAGAGTELSFTDEPWEERIVSHHAVFSGLEVTVDGETCASEAFLLGPAAHDPDLGCRIQVLASEKLSGWHQGAMCDYGSTVLVNFHGQTVSFVYAPTRRHDLRFLVELTGQPTPLRLMLPARTRLVENEGLKQLKAALEIEAFRYLKAQGRHRLTYSEYLRAQELGIELPEATPQYRVGTLWNDMAPEPVKVEMPPGFTLGQCYRFVYEAGPDDSDEANVHLLAALGTLTEPFVPVDIHRQDQGYSWAKLPTVDRVILKVGKTRAESWAGGGTLTCVDALKIIVTGSDGRAFESQVCMARSAEEGEVRDYSVYVTPAAQQRLTTEHIWYHLGGYDGSGDTYETQLQAVEAELTAFWQRLEGPYETLRAGLLACVQGAGLKGWRSVTILPGGKVTIELDSGNTKTLLPPQQEVAP